jgi:hypothetical protein
VDFSDAIRNFIPSYFPNDGVILEYMSSVLLVLEILAVVYCDINREVNLPFRGPRIVIYSYNKSQQDALFLKLIFDKEL